MTTPHPDPDPPTVATRRGWRRFVPRGRAAVIGASVLALLVVIGVAVALIPGGPGYGPGRHGHGPDDFGMPGLSGELDGPGGFGGPGGPGGPGGFGPGRDGGRGEHGPRGGFGDRGLGADTLLAGSVVSTAEGSLVVTPDGAPQRTIRTNGDTRVRGGGNQALGDLAPGERVVVRINGTGDAATAVAVLVPQARVTGTVTAVAGGRATVVSIDGLTSTVDVTALAQQPAVGNLAAFTGVATNPTTLKADGVRLLPKTP